jgi:hypothetical protein
VGKWSESLSDVSGDGYNPEARPRDESVDVSGSGSVGWPKEEKQSESVGESGGVGGDSAWVHRFAFVADMDPSAFEHCREDDDDECEA